MDLAAPVSVPISSLKIHGLHPKAHVRETRKLPCEKRDIPIVQIIYFNMFNIIYILLNLPELKLLKIKNFFVIENSTHLYDGRFNSFASELQTPYRRNSLSYSSFALLSLLSQSFFSKVNLAFLNIDVCNRSRKFKLFLRPLVFNTSSIYFLSK